MNIHHGLRVAAIAACALLMTACVTNRSTLSLEVPSAEAAADTGRVAVITTVTDQRRFEERPSDPSTPSLKRGDAYRLDERARTQAIARKRNTYGMAIGDIVLEGSTTVEDLTRDLIAHTLISHGYRLVSDGTQAPADAVRVSAVIREFWAWFTPGLFAADMEARVGTTLTVDGPEGTREIPIDGYGRNSVQIARDENWRLTYRRAFEDYLEKQAAALSTSGR